MAKIEVQESLMKHSFGVASKCYEEALKETENEEFARKMYLLGLIHDIGRAFDNNNHEKAGAEVIRSISFNELQFLADAIAAHGTPRKDMTKWERLLKLGDIQVNAQGEEVSFKERLEDIKERYGGASGNYERAKRQVEVLKNAR